MTRLIRKMLKDRQGRIRLAKVLAVCGLWTSFFAGFLWLSFRMAGSAPTVFNQTDWSGGQADNGNTTLTGWTKYSATALTTLNNTGKDPYVDVATTPGNITIGTTAGNLTDDTDVNFNEGNLTAEWSMDEGSGITAGDTSGNGNAGRHSGSSLVFDGVDDYVNLNNPLSLQISTGTVTAWIKTSDAVNTWAFIVSKNNAYSLYLTKGKLAIYDYSTFLERITTINIADNKWHFVAVTFQSGISNGTNLYIDNDITPKLTTTMTISNQGSPVYAGTQEFATTFFKGSIDEVRIYNRVLSAAEINEHSQGIYSNNSQLKGLWHLKEGTGQTVADDSGNANNGTLGPTTGVEASDPSWQTDAPGVWLNPGKFGSALSFDGVDDFVTVQDSNSLDIASQITVSAWVKLNDLVSTGIAPAILVKNNEYLLRYEANSSNTFGFYLYDGVDWEGHASYTVSGMNTNTWYHVVGTWDGTTQKIYVNGDNTPPSATITHSFTALATANNLEIGKWGTGSYFKGAIDDVRVYNTALTQNQIKAVMANAKGKGNVAGAGSGTGAVLKLAYSAGSSSCDYDHCDMDWTPTNGDAYDLDATANIGIAGTHCNINNFTVAAGTTYVYPYSGTTYGSLNLYARNAVVTGTLDASEKGYRRSDNGTGSGSTGAAPGGGISYGVSTAPNNLGSAGGNGGTDNAYLGGVGGGLIKLNILNALTINGTIISNGGAGTGGFNGDASRVDGSGGGYGGAGGAGNDSLSWKYSGGGSGGGVYINADTLAGAGGITVNGGNAVNPSGDGGGGGAGRIALYYKSKAYSGALTANGGAAGGNAGTAAGSPSTPYDAGVNSTPGPLTAFKYLSSGTYTSRVYDTNGLPLWGNMTWTDTVPVGTTLTLKVRTSINVDMSGATDWASCTPVTKGENIFTFHSNSVHNADRYVQYQASFTSDSTNTLTPSLDKVIIDYNIYPIGNQEIISSYFNSGGAAWGINQLRWIQDKPTGTTIGLQLQTAPDNIGVPGAWSAWLGPTSGSDYYIDPAGGEIINPTHHDSLSDQWFRYKIVLSTNAAVKPTLLDLNIDVVAAIPAAPTPIAPSEAYVTKYAKPMFVWSVADGVVAQEYGLKIDSLAEITGITETSYRYTGVDLANSAHTWKVRVKVSGVWSNYSTVTNFTVNTLSTVNDIANLSTTLTLNGTQIRDDVSIISGGILNHGDNTTTKTNWLNLIVMGNLTISGTGKIDVSGLGYDGGAVNGAGNGPGGGVYVPFYGSGGGYGGNGGNGATAGAVGGNTYGSITALDDLGSGGSGGGNGSGARTGGAGGGLVKLTVSGTLTNNGSILADGAGPSGSASGGAGGGIYINTGILAGSGLISSKGAVVSDLGYGAGGGGRIAVYYTSSSFPIANITAYGGATGYQKGGAGTIYLKGTLIIDNNNSAGAATTTFPLATLTFDNLIIQNKGELTVPSGAGITALNTGAWDIGGLIIDGSFTANSVNSLTINGIVSVNSTTSMTGLTSGLGTVVINSGGVLTHKTNTIAPKTNFIDWQLAALTINLGGSINVLGKGYSGGALYTNGNGPGGGGYQNLYGGGGGYGGRGGNGYSGTNNGGVSNGSVIAPNDLGSGGSGGGNGSGARTGGAGGGLVKLNVSGILTNNGTIIADGAGPSGTAAGGSGGAVYINAGTLAGSGTISAIGAVGIVSASGAGGGGRIALYYTSSSFPIANITVYGGATGYQVGGAGTIYRKQVGSYTLNMSAWDGDLIVDNNSVSGAATTMVDAVNTFTNLTVQKNANLDIPSGKTVTTTNFTLANSGTFATVGSMTTSNLTVNGAFNLNTNLSVNPTRNVAYGPSASLVIPSGVTLTHDANTTAKTNYIDWSLGSLTVNSGGSIDANGKGYAGGGAVANTDGNGTGKGYAYATGNGGGGGYGGTGGNGNPGGTGGITYGLPATPNDLGSGGATGNSTSTPGGAGGGLIKLNISGTLSNNGVIATNGISAGNWGAGGSGGGVYLIAGIFSGNGSITANGGLSAIYGGGGGGGRIAVSCTTFSFTGTSSVTGGTGANAGNAGTLYGLVDHYNFTVTTPQGAGAGFSATVTAKDSSNNIIPASLSVTLTTTGSARFYTAAEAGAGYLAAGATTLAYTSVAGAATIYVKDNVKETVVLTATDANGKSGSAAVVIDPGVLHHFTITGNPATAAAGTPFASPANDIVVTAYDSVNNIKTNYTGSVYFTSTDAQAVLPYTSLSKYIFVGGDNGVHTFAGTGFTLKTTPSQTITVTDGAISQASIGSTVTPAALASFTITGYPATTIAGVAFVSPANDIVVTAKDVYLNTKTDYAGSVYFTSTDLQAVLPFTSVLPYTFVPATDNGIHTFAGTGFNLKIMPARTITVTNGTISQVSNSITVNPNTAVKFTITGSGTQVAGAAQPLTIRAYDTYDNLASAGANNYNGNYALTFSGAGTVGSAGVTYNPTVTDKTGAKVNFGAPTTITFANGVSSAGASMVLYKAEAASISAASGVVTTPAPLLVTVAPALTITIPNGAELWNSGKAYNITWTTNAGAGVANVKLSYSTNGGTSYTDIITDSVVNTSPYSWTVPEYLSGMVKVKIDAVNDPAVLDESDNVFSIIPPALTVLTPSVAGITLLTGQAYNITWSNQGVITNNLALYYSTDSGVSYPNTIVTGKANDGIYSWSVPFDPGPGMKVKVEDVFYQSLKDTNDAQFNLGAYSNTVVNSTGIGAGVKINTGLLSGNFTSRVLDTGGNQNFGKLDWTADVPVQCGAGAVKFQLASANLDTGPWTYYGPTGAGDYYTVSATQINSVHNGQRYVRYKAYLATVDSLYTPTVQDVRISFTDDILSSRVISDDSDNIFTIAPKAITVADVEPVSKVVGVSGNVNVSFTTLNIIPADGKIVVSFPAGFTFNSGGATTAASTMDGTLSVGITGQVVTITRSGVTQQAAGAQLITLTNVKNPSNTGLTNTYSLSTQTSANKKIDEAASIAGDIIIAGGALSATNVQPLSLQAGAVGSVDVSFTTVNPIPADGRIIVTFPAGFTLNSGGVTAASSGVIDGVLAVSISGQVVTITRSGGTQQAAGAKLITLTNIKNYPITGPTGLYAIQTTSSSGAGNGLIDQDLAVASDVIIPGVATGFTVALADNASGRSTGLTLNFIAANPVSAGGKVELVFDLDFVITGSTFVSGNAGASILSRLNNTIIMSLGTAVGAGQTVSLVLDGVNNPLEGQVTDNYIIRTKTAGDLLIDTGTAPGSVIQGMKITSPNGAEKWEANKAYKITWNFYQVLAVSLFYSVDGGAYQPIAGAQGMSASLGEFNWTVPSAVSSNVKVKISVPASLPEIFDVSDNAFFIIPTPAVTFVDLHPAGAAWIMGTTQTLDWSSNYSASNTVKIEFSSDGVTYSPINENYGTPNDGIVANNLPVVVSGTAANTLSWVVPVLGNASAACRIKITGTDNYIVPAQNFTVISNPFTINLSTIVVGEIAGQLVAGDTKTVTWTKTGTTAGYVKLYYAVDFNPVTKTGTWVQIPDGVTPILNSGTYDWVIPANINSTSVGLKIEDNDRPAQVNDYSDAVFSVRYPTITLGVFPDPAEPLDDDSAITLVKGDTRAMTFTTERNFGANLKLQCINSADSLVLAETTAGITYTHPNGSINWVVPVGAVGVGRQIKIVDSTRPVSSNLSGVFKVLDKAKYKILRPAANEEIITRLLPDYTSNVSPLKGITWLAIGDRAKQANSANVILQYVKDGTAGSIQTTPNDGNYENWTVTYDLRTNDMKIRVSGGTNYDASAISSDSASFKVRADINVTVPAGPVNWDIGSNNHAITWTTYGKITKVKIDYWNGIQWLNLANNLLNPDISDNYAGVVNSYNWNIPNDDLYRSAGGGKLRVTAAEPVSASIVYGEVLGVNVVEPALNVSINLPPSLKWIRGDTQRVSWTYGGQLTNAGSLRLAYAAKAVVFDPATLLESDWTTIATIAVTNNFYDWQLPIDFAQNYAAIRVIDINANRPNSKGYSSVFQCLPSPYISLTSPSGVPSWRTGEDRAITWTGTEGVNTGYLKIEYSLDNITWLAVANAAGNPAINQPASGSFSWRIPQGVLAPASGSQLVYIRIADTQRAITPMLPASVTLSVVPPQINVTSPVSTDKWVVDEAKVVTWTSTGGEGAANFPVNIQYKLNSDLIWTDLLTNYSAVANGTSSYSLSAVPNSVGMAQIRVVDTYRAGLNCPTCWVPSAEFAIYGKFTSIAVPAGDLQVGNSANITWVTKGAIPGNQIEIYYYTGVFDLSNPLTTKKLADGAVSALSSPYSWAVIPDFVNDSVKLRIRDKRAADNAGSYQDSIVFRIIPVLNLVNYPGKTAGESYVVGSATNITWQATGTLSKVNLQYSFDNGASWYDMAHTVLNGFTQVNNIPPYTYNWVLPDTISGNVKVKVFDPNKPVEVVNSSVNVFKIIGQINLIYPNGLEQWVIGAQREVKWNVTAGTFLNVILQYSPDNGTTWKSMAGVLAQETLAPNVPLRTYLWTLPDDFSENAKVRVAAENYLSNTDVSDLSFSILSPVITITQPTAANVGNSSLTVNEPYDVKWTTEGMKSMNVDIKCSYDNKTNWFVVALNQPNSASGTISWTPAQVTTNGWIKIEEISNTHPGAIKYSGPFTVLPTPVINITSPAVPWIMGKTYIIEWNSANIVHNNLAIDYTLNASVPTPVWVNIALAEQNDGLYTWAIPDLPVLSDSIHAKIRITDNTAFSPGKFTVGTTNEFTLAIPKLTFTRPVGGEVWAVGEKIPITWVNSGSVIGPLALQYDATGVISASSPLLDGNLNKTGAPVNSYSYTWAVPNEAVSQSVKVGIKDTQRANTRNDSAGVFTVIAKPTITVTSPASGADFVIEESMAINWQVRGSSVGNLNIELWDDLNSNNIADIGETVQSIATGLSRGTSDTADSYSGKYTGVYTWAIPAQAIISANLKLRVYDPVNAIEGLGAGHFRIRGGFQFRSEANSIQEFPASTDWKANSPHQLKWYNKGVFDKVKLEYAVSSDGNTWGGWVTVNAALVNSPDAARISSYSWVVPDPHQSLYPAAPPVNYYLKLRVASVADPTINAVSNVFKVSYYMVTWKLKDYDMLTPLNHSTVLATGGGINYWNEINDTLTYDIGVNYYTRRFPYSTVTSTWSKEGYISRSDTDRAINGDITVNVLLESTISAQLQYKVYSAVAYNEDSKELKVSTWLEKKGTLINPIDPDLGVGGSSYIKVYDGETLVRTTISAGADSNGNFWFTIANATKPVSEGGLGLISGKTYFVKVGIYYRSRLYESGSSFDITISQKLKEVTDLIGNTTKTIEIATNQIAAQSQFLKETVRADTERMTETLTTRVGKVLTATETVLPTKMEAERKAIISEVAKQVEPHVQSGILNRDSVVKQGKDVTIRYRTASGLSPVVDVYDPNNLNKVSKAVMKEIGNTGVYEYTVKFDSRWDKGDYTVMTSESTKGTLDAMVMTAQSTNLEDVASQISSGGVSLASGDIEGITTALTSQLNTISATINTLAATTGEALKSGANSNMDAMVSALKKAAKDIKDLGGVEGYNLDDLFEVSDAQSKDLKYLANKTAELKKLLELVKQLMEKNSEDPVIQTWYESGSVIIRSLVVNPSKKNTRTVPFKQYLPKEVKSEDIMDKGDLELTYDTQQGMYFVHQEIELGPGESKKLAVEIEDIWVIDEKEARSLREQATKYYDVLKETPFVQRADFLLKKVDNQLSAIMARQGNAVMVNPEEHISVYRENVKALALAKEDILEMERISRGTFHISPLATWWMIIIIVIFLAVLSLFFFLVWQKKLKKLNVSADEIIMKEKEKEKDDSSGSGEDKNYPHLPPL